MRQVWIGYDERQPLGSQVMGHSIKRHATKPVLVGDLMINQLPISRTGATSFTYTRWLVPWLMGYEGIGIFCDEDMAVRGDIHELFDYCETLEDWDVAVMKEQEPYEWPSVIVFNNERCKKLTPEFVEDEGNPMFGFGWTDKVASFPKAWNHCVGYAPNPEPEAKLYHWTQGIPYWTEVRGLPEDDIWMEEFQTSIHSCEWVQIHRHTKHFEPVMRRFLAGYGLRIPEKKPIIT